MEWEAILLTAGASALFTGFLAFLFQSWIGQWFTKRLEEFRDSLEREAFEHETRYSKLHEKRAEVIAEFYKRLARLKRTLDDVTRAMEMELSEKIVTDTAISLYPQDATLHLREFVSYADEVRIFFPRDMGERIETLREDYMLIFGILAMVSSTGLSEIDDKEEMTRLLGDFRKGVRHLSQDVEKYFATLLGVESAYSQGNS